MNKFILLFLFLFSSLSAIEKDDAGREALYNSLDPFSLSQQISFYQLYPDSTQGERAIKTVWELLYPNHTVDLPKDIQLPMLDLQAIISLITRQGHQPTTILTSEQLDFIEQLTAHLPHRQLKGHQVWTREEVLELPPEEIDIARGLLLYEQEQTHDQIRQYEVMLDLMALQILRRLPPFPSPLDKVREINRLVFLEMGFRFPPHSLYAKDVDLYTFLPSVLDGRQGVCLGVSIIYLCLAQRLSLDLEIITPPGHIYIRHNDGETITNIETTARGINMPCETYLGINTRKLQLRNQKEVIGMAFFNQAAVYWGREEHAMAVKLYEKARLFIPDDPLIKMFLGFNYLFLGKKSEGKNLLKSLRGYLDDTSVSPDGMVDDYLTGRVNEDGLKAIFQHVDSTRESIIEKQETLKKILTRYPKFRAGIMQLATTWMQLGRSKEALALLERHHQLDPHDATVEYYLAILSMQRIDYNKAWNHLKNSEKIAAERDHYPVALRSLRQSIRQSSPEP